MTIKELSQLYWLNREIEYDQQRLEELEMKAASPATPKLDGMPRSGSPEGSRLEALVLEIIDLQAIIAAKQIQCIHERQRLERYIATVPDSLTRMILTFRFVNGLPWAQVAHSIGGGNTEDSVKKCCYRYLRATEEESESEDDDRPEDF